MAPSYILDTKHPKLKQTQTMKTIAVYGSLKKGLGNDWGTRDGNFLGTTITNGEMYSLGAYPVLIETGTKEYEIEIYEITDLMYEQIYRMEIGAGYIAKEIKTQKGIAIIFYGDPKRFQEDRLNTLKKVNEWPPK